ncbi:hypothetical protein A8924_6520 [Saccharopolyspora erythraea NRRL 2338]|nr:hypothetical protein [Saccharopolyspora erythraea]PFG98990.1 hypothetical protein A8924_6520 [Saccharopolyspora erythraea NRRL 2338]QRK88963.1 hypothetical protein JQX30_30920 [Saccharopolyspora erythraea]
MNPKMKAVFQLVSALSAVFGLRASFRDARANNDKLALADTIITTLGLITGTALAVRTLRRGEDADK